jgi:hypothetical protein
MEMSGLRPWSTKPGVHPGVMEEFVAGAAAVSDSRVLAVPRDKGRLQALALIAAVPSESTELAKLVDDHEKDVEGVDYHSRWATILPTAAEPYALARLDLRFGGATTFETRLLFDIRAHTNDLWAAVHSGCIRLVSPDRFPRRPDIMTEAGDVPRALIISCDASPLRDALAKLGVSDPFMQACR